MNYQEYLAQAARTECDYTHVCDEFAPYSLSKLTHYALGLATEALELQESIRLGKPRDEQLMELSDICWFSALAADHLGCPPDEKTFAKYIDLGIHHIYQLCEDFASRVKAGLCYGSPVRKGEGVDMWRQLPAKIFALAVAAGRRNSADVLAINVAKLQKRYGNKFTAPQALDRNTAAETAAVAMASDKEIKTVLEGKV